MASALFRVLTTILVRLNYNRVSSAQSKCRTNNPLHVLDFDSWTSMPIILCQQLMQLQGASVNSVACYQFRAFLHLHATMHFSQSLHIRLSVNTSAAETCMQSESKASLASCMSVLLLNCKQPQVTSAMLHECTQCLHKPSRDPFRWVMDLQISSDRQLFVQAV